MYSLTSADGSPPSRTHVALLQPHILRAILAHVPSARQKTRMAFVCRWFA